MSERKVSRKFQLISGLLLLFFTACPTPPKRVEKVTPLMAAAASPEVTLEPFQIEEPPMIVAPPQMDPPVIPPEPNQPGPGNDSQPGVADSLSAIEDNRDRPIPAEDKHDVPPIAAEAAPAPVQPVPNYLSGLTPMQDWLQSNYPGSLLQKANAHSFTLETAQGRVLLTPGNRFAQWNGMNFGLGYAPVYRQGKLCLHSIDLQKSLVPLLNDPPKKLPGQRIVVIDPGHGGENYGTKSISSRYYEKDLTLDWALRIQKSLADSDWKVILTRTNDVHVDLLNRVALADAVQADLFISLHFNSAANGGKAGPESGMETYCLTPTGLPSNIIREFEDDTGKIFPNNSFDHDNFLYAARIQRNLVHLTGRRDRGVRRARFMTVLREQRRPAVLVEGGFLSNPAEATLINDPSFRQRLAMAVRKSLIH